MAAARFLALSFALAQAAPWKSELADVSPLSTTRVRGGDQPWKKYNQTVHWFDEQIVDHFAMSRVETYRQRYFVIDDFWEPPHGPVILHVCGEYTCPGIMPARLFPLEMAYKHKALVVSVEHRFFGETMPRPNLSTSNLRVGNSRQALNDLANFLTWFQQAHINEPHGFPRDHLSKWVVVGGSYPGALASWFRLKYPHLTVGSHSSSGVVLSVLRYDAFDEQVARSAGTVCANALRAATKEAEQQMPGIKKSFGAEALEDGDFFRLIADAGAEPIQYGARNILCNAVVPSFQAGKPVLPAFINFTKSYFYKTMGSSPNDYNRKLLADPEHGGNGRSWMWQVCTELAYWQVAPASNPVRSKQVDEQYYRDLCNFLFGLTELPLVNETNVYYGGNVTAADETVFDNGIQDPWQWAGVRESLGATKEAVVVDCDGCAHCSTLYTPTDSDPAPLQQARDLIRQKYEKWLG